MTPVTEHRPLFVLAGMPRAGTTYLYHVLAAHPGFHVTLRKELRYFSHHYAEGADWYARQFSAALPHAVCADLSPDYFMHAGAAERIARYPGQVRVALLIRDPAQWAVSLHRHLRSFEPDVPAFPDFLRQCRYPDFQWPSRPRLGADIALTGGFVSRRIEEFRQALGGRLLLYDFAAFERDPLGTLRAIESFTGIRQPLSATALPPDRINARSGSERRRLTYWLSREPVSNLLGRLMPAGLALQLRRQWESKASPPSARDDAADLEFAQESLAADRERIVALFRDSPAMLGDGTPLTSPPSPMPDTSAV